MATMLLCILLSIVLGLLTLVSVVFTIISFANSKKNKFLWLCIFIGALLGMIVSIFFAVSSGVKRVKHFAESMEKKISTGDSMGYTAYNFADSINSKQIQYLKLIQPKENKAPEQFYNYLGFRDYYRMPLRYPFSLHCTDVLTNASLFDELEVERFNENDNGEKDCGLNNIISFAFDENILVAEILPASGVKEKNGYMIYHFSSGETEKIKNLEDVTARAKELQFTRPLKFFTCKEYYDLF